MVWAG